MFRLNVLNAVFLLSVLTAPVSSLAADDRPVPPADPKSQEECRAYRRQHMDYAHIAVEKSRECSARNRAADNEDIVLFQPSCGGRVLSAFRSCTEASDAAWCALTDFSEKISACFEKASAAERKSLTDAVARNEKQKKNESEKLIQGLGAAAPSGTDDPQEPAQQERAGRLEQDLAAARRDAETQAALVTKLINDASQQKQIAEQGSAELKRSLQKEHEKAEALAKDLAMAHAAIYAYEAQAREVSDKAAQSRQVESDAAALRKSLQQEQERAGRLEQDLAAARRDAETRVALAAKAGADATRLKQDADNSAAESLRLLQRERDRTARLERELASERKTKDLPAVSRAMATAWVAQDKQPWADAAPLTSAAARSNARPDPGTATETVRLVARASVLLGQGDIASARVVLERAVEAGNAQASFALAETYDPLVLRKWGAYGTLGDAAKARDFYARALASGIDDARERFDALRDRAAARTAAEIRKGAGQ